MEHYTAFAGHALLARGPLDEVLLHAKRELRARPAASVLVFSDLTGKQMDFDLSGSERELLQRIRVYLEPAASPATGGPGRPRLGVVAREVSLLPRHWDWLATQSGGASSTLRRLVEEASRGATGAARARQAQERAHKFMSALAGDLAGYEEALRALYAKDARKFRDRTADWPAAVREYTRELAEAVFG